MTRKLFHAGHDHDESEVEIRGESFVLPFKILSAVVLFFVTILVFFSGKIIKRKLSVSPLLICYIECMCAGLYLGFGVCHMLPDSAYIFQNMGGRVPQANPSYVLFLFGFFVIMCIERIMTNKMMKTEQKEVQFDNSTMMKPETELTITNSDCSCYTSNYIENSSECKNAVISSFHHHYAHDESRSKILSIALLVSLCFHGIFEGIAIGIQNDAVNLVIFVVAMIIHKCGEAFGMGISFAKSNAKPRVWIPSAIVFSLMIPVGIIISLLSKELGLESDYASAVSGAIAAGCLFYSSITIIMEKISDSITLVRKLIFVGVGILGIYCISVLSEFL